MSRESSLNAQISNLSDSSEELIYRPRGEDLRLKTKFEQLTRGNPLLDVKNLPMEEVERILECKLKHKDKPGFAGWFLNKDENAQKLEYLFSLALNAAEDILCNTDPKAQSARVNMIKAVSELAGKIPSRSSIVPGGQSGQNLLSSIGQMDKASLKAFLQKNGTSVDISVSSNNSPATIDVTPEIKDEP